MGSTSQKTSVVSAASPCDLCIHTSKCKTGMACKDFTLFFQYGHLVCRDRNPEVKHYNRTFANVHAKSK